MHVYMYMFQRVCYIGILLIYDPVELKRRVRHGAALCGIYYVLESMAPPKVDPCTV